MDCIGGAAVPEIIIRGDHRRKYEQSALFSSKARRSPLLFGKAVAAEAPAQLNTSIRLMILVFIFILLTSSNIYFWKYF